uniref:Putative endonuclease n=1 Tax=Naegleria morganensis TaxID=159475 RepID=Q966Z8_9EUKA|nr:putative endonuclease [Naegleria morganensis]
MTRFLFVETFTDYISKKDLPGWADTFIDEVEKKALPCRHGDCWRFGSKDGDKHPGIRKSTVINHMCRYMSLDKKSDSKTSTKVRCYHISFVSRYKNKHVLFLLHLERLKNPEEYVIRHTCGCKDCCNPEHLKLGTKSDNEYDKGIHEYLQRVYESCEEDYHEIVKLLKKNKVYVK